MHAPPPKSAFGNIADLDVRHAWRMLGGKSTEDAFQIFIQNPFGQVDNFRWIAPAAFIFYFSIVVRYITGDDSKGDSDTVSSLAGILEFQLEQHRHAFMPVFGDIAALCRHVIGHYAEYDLDYDIYGDVKSRYEQIRNVVEPDAPPNGGPATLPGNPRVTEGPPSGSR